MLRAAALTCSCAVLALTAAGCGESASGGDGDPASLVPVGTAFYLEAAIQPQGERRDDALAAAGKLMRTDDPAAELRGLVDEALADEGGGMTWEKDFAPWVGEDAGMWGMNLDAEEPDFAAIVATKDPDAAEAAIERIKASEPDVTYTERSHAGVTYDLDESDDTAVGMVDDFVVVATDAAFRRTAEMAEGGENLADADRYKDAVGDDDDALGHYFLDFKPLMDAALKQDPQAAAQLERFKSILPVDRLGPMTGSFEADGDGLALETVMTGVPEGPFRRLVSTWAGGGTDLLGELPGDAWGAFATPKLGETAETLFNSFAGAVGGAAVAAQVQQATGLNLQEDVFSWIGDVAVYAHGETEADLGGAIVIAATDDGKAETAFGKLIGLLGQQSGTQAEPVSVDGAESAFAFTSTDVPQPVVLARGEGRVVAALGEQAAEEALSPSAKLADSDLHGDAEEVLGDEFTPAFLLSVDTLVRLVETFGETDAEWAEVKPYLESIGVITSGGKADGDRVESRMAVSLK